ncbi:MAG: nucleotidyltransferase domain-containing protein [Planctomycetaceae bacterium]|nr:nucleotidyltransferase domain-containing protein [Planctomycetaceae bacterium]
MLQSFVQATHRIPVLSHGYRAFYAVVLNRFIAAVRHLPAVETVMLKGSYARDELVPGMSDIDLAIVIRDDTTFSQLYEIAETIFAFKQGMVLSHCPIVGEIEIFSHSDATSSMFEGYSRRFSWRVVWGVPVRISESSYDSVERIWTQFGKFVFFHYVARHLAAPRSLLHRDMKLARAIGVHDVPSEHLKAHVALIRRFDELLAQFVSPEASYPQQFVTDCVGPFTGCGDTLKKQYILIEDYKIPPSATEFGLTDSWLDNWFLPPTFVGPNAMRFVIGPFEDREAKRWSEMNLQTVRYQWRGSLLNNVTSEGFLSRNAYNDIVRLVRALAQNSLYTNANLTVPSMVSKDAKVEKADFQRLFEIMSSVQYPSSP